MLLCDEKINLIAAKVYMAPSSHHVQAARSVFILNLIISL